MFVLTKVGRDDEKFVLLPSKPVYTVGRLDTDFIIKDDLSISRTHVRFHLPSAEGEPLKIEDLGSKYGTYLNENIEANEKMEAKSATAVFVGNKVRFGGMQNVWQVTQLNLATATSALTRVQIQGLEQVIRPLNGRLMQDWTEECTHMTMSEVSITVKLLHALLDNKPIVNLLYWKELLRAARGIHVLDGWPKPQNFPPAPLANVNIKWQPERTKLFAGITFVFMNRKHFDMYGKIVQKAGGAYKDLNAGVRKTFLTRKNVAVVQYAASSQSQATETINNIADILQQAGLRIIPEYEIGLAILHCSIGKYCNPSYKLNDDLCTTESMGATEELSVNSSMIVPNTMTQSSQASRKFSEVTVPESESNNSIECIVSEEPKPIATSTQFNAQKRNHVIFLDSSDESDNEPIIKKSKLPNGAIVELSKISKKNPNNVQTTSPRRSPRGKPVVTAPKPTTPDENEELFQFNRQPATEKTAASQPKTPPLLKPTEANARPHTKSAARPLPNVKINQPARISVRNFLEKSQILSTNQKETASATVPASQSRKRTIIKLLNESDSDDDVFNFGDSKKPKKSKSNSNNQDDLFNFTSASTQKQSDTDPEDDEDLIETQPYLPKTEKKSKYVVREPKQLPRTINVSSWLTKQVANTSIAAVQLEPKRELSIKQEIDNSDDEQVTHDQWLASIRNGIQVRMSALAIKTRSSLDQTDADAPSDKYNGRKNFKKFVKQTILHPQQRIVPLKRMQLADGFATDL